MDNIQQATSGANTEASGSVAQNELESTSGDQNSKTAYDKLLKEKRNTALALQKAREELEDLKGWKSKEEEEKLLKEKNFETVIENLKKKLNETETELLTTKKKIEGAKVNSAVISELKKLGFVDNETNRGIAIKLIETNSVGLDPSTGVVVGADEAAKEFYSKYNTLGVFGKTQAGANHNAPKTNLINTGVADFKQMKKEQLIETLKGLPK